MIRSTMIIRNCGRTCLFKNSRNNTLSTQFLYPVSYFSTAVPLVQKTLGNYFDEKVNDKNNQWSDAFRDVKSEYRWTHTEYKKAVDGVANGLAQQYQRGEHLAVMLGCHTDSPVTFFSAAKAGVQPVFIDPSISVPQLQKFMKTSKSSAIVFAESHNLENHEEKILEVFPSLKYWPPGYEVKIDEFPHLKGVLEVGQPENDWAGRFFHLFTPVSWPPILPKISQQLNPNSDALTILDSHGNRVVYSHMSILNNGISVSHALGLSKDRIANFVPYHSYGHIVATVGCLESVSVHLVPEVNLFLEEEVLNTLQKEHVSVIVSPIDYLHSLSKSSSFKNRKFDHLRKIVLVVDGAEANEISKSKLSQLKQDFNVENVDVLVGVREAGIILNGTFKGSESSLSLSPLPHMSIKSTSGQLQVKGYNVSTNYPDGKPSTLSSDGWLTTEINGSHSGSQIGLSLKQ